MLEEIDELTEKNPEFLRAYYLAARICRTDYQFTDRFIPYINAAFEVVDYGKYTNRAKSFLYYELAKFYEVHNYSIERIKEAFTEAEKSDQGNFFALYKKAEYLYKSGDVDYAVKILNAMEYQLVDHFKSYDNMLPKRRIHGYKCCIFLGNIEYSRHNYDVAEMFYKKAINLALDDCTYFTRFREYDKDNQWEKIFYMCMSLTPVTSSMMRIYEKRSESIHEANTLERQLYKGLEEDLRKYWKKIN